MSSRLTSVSLSSVDNSPSNPSIVPAFETFQDLGDKMGEVLTSATGVGTTVTIVYNEGSDSDPGSFRFGIAFEKNFDPLVLSFSKSLSLGDLATVSVQDSSFSIGGGFSVEAELGVIFAPDNTTPLKLLGSLNIESTDCTPRAPIPFYIIYELSGADELYNETMSIDPDCSTKDALLDSLGTAFNSNSNVSRYVANVTQVGESSFSVIFDGEIR